MNTGKIISDLREQKGWGKKDLAEKSGISRVMIGKYERSEAVPSIEAVNTADALEVSLDNLVGASSLTAFDERTDVAAKMAEALGVTLDYLVKDGKYEQIDNEMLKLLKEVQGLDEENSAHIFATVTAFIKAAKLKSIAALYILKRPIFIRLGGNCINLPVRFLQKNSNF